MNLNNKCDIICVKVGDNLAHFHPTQTRSNVNLYLCFVFSSDTRN